MPQLLKIHITGAVQGTGFRPFVYRLAKELNLGGFVQNTPGGVLIEAEGDQTLLELFLLRLQQEKPAISAIYSLEHTTCEPAGFTEFRIVKSDEAGEKSTTILPDIATCRKCLDELHDPSDRRYRYPFINCTNCGPRYSIIQGIPYDRISTTMSKFMMCPDCQREYEDPTNRRFHAQPNACPVCGPHLELWNHSGKVLATKDDALQAAAKIIREGRILALKGIGGFQLLVDAENDVAVQRLRKRKHRNAKPLAIMYPLLEVIKKNCAVSILEESLLTSPASPIVLLKRNDGVHTISKSVAPSNPYIGSMLPYSPLHHLLMNELGFPVVATSGNLSDEPICVDELEALKHLGDIADGFLVNDRPIARQIDDSVVRVVAGKAQVLRRSRGYAPLPIHLSKNVPAIIATGAHLKNTVAVTKEKEIFISQHIGDLSTTTAYAAFKQTINDLAALYETTPTKVACDLHPDYLSTKYATELSQDMVQVQHHYAHVLSCMADNEIDGPVLGVSWDGTGYGTDGTSWGSEFLITTPDSFERFGHFRTFRLPGGETAIKQPWRSAVGILYEITGNNFSDNAYLPTIQNAGEAELRIILQMLKKHINSPVTCSAGRLFDAVASITGLRQQSAFEGQAAMDLEFAITESIEDAYPFDLQNSTPCIVDWQPIILGIIDDIKRNVNNGIIAAKFHNAMSEIIVQMAHKAGLQKIVLSGGCFQNKYLTERTVVRLREEGFQPYWHQRIPPNDGGISAGQAIAAYKLYKQPPRVTKGEILGINDFQ